MSHGHHPRKPLKAVTVKPMQVQRFEEAQALARQILEYAALPADLRWFATHYDTRNSVWSLMQREVHHRTGRISSEDLYQCKQWCPCRRCRRFRASV